MNAAKFYLPFRWLRRAAQALRRWAGGLGLGRSALSCRTETVGGDVQMVVKEFPLQPPEILSHSRLSSDQCERLREAVLKYQAESIRSETLTELADLARSGVTLCALLEPPEPGKRSAVLAVKRRE